MYEHGVRRLYYQLHEDRAIALAASALGGRRRILELGCGPGRALEHLAGQLPYASLTGVDLSPYMLERARGRTPAGVRLEHANTLALPFADGAFDAVLAMHHLGHVPRKAIGRAWRETLRVLDPRGVLVLVEHTWHRFPRAGAVRVSEEKLAGGIMRVTCWQKTTSGVAAAPWSQTTEVAP